MMRFAQPWLLAFGAPLVLFVLFRLRSLPASLAGGRRRFVQGCLSLGAIAGLMAAAGLELGHPVDRMAVVFVVDRSRSVVSGADASADALDEVRGALGTLARDDAAGVVVFASRAATERLPSAPRDLGPTTVSLPREGTDIEAGLRRALADLPDGYVGRLVLLSDGNATQGDALAAAAAAAARGVTVDVLPIEREPGLDIAIESVRAPAQVEGEEPVEVRIVTRATRATSARVIIDRDGSPLAQADIELPAGEDVFVFRDRAPGPGLHHYEVSLVPEVAGEDVAALNNHGGAFTRVVGPARALIVAGETAHSAALAEATRVGGLDTTVIGPASIPTTLGEFGAYDVVLLSDVNARALSEAQMQALAAYVRDFGGGLVMLGAHDAFGLGGYAYTEVEEVLPATFDLRRRRDRLSLAMVIAIDNSGSMSVEVSPGRTKLDLANEAAARSAILLSVNDRVGVMHVDTEVHWTQAMTSVQEPEAIAAAVRRASPGGGGIYVDITLEASYEALRSENTQLRHLLLFSDGDDSEEMTRASALVRAAASAEGGEVTTSIVSMGNGIHTAELERLSTLGGGRFYIVEDMTELPRIFTQETIEASRSALRREPTPVSLGERGAPTDGVDIASAPALLGYSLVNARPEASVLLIAGESDPLLATWQRGLGRSAVFTTDSGARYAAPWLGWSGYAPLMAQLARDVARPRQDQHARVQLTFEGAEGRVVVEALDAEGRYRNHMTLRAHVAGPHGQSEALALTQTGPGRYEATFTPGAPGPYLVTTSADDSLLGTSGAVLTAADELRGVGTQRALLAQIAALTGGRVRTDLAEALRERPAPRVAYDPLWEWALRIALLALLLSVAGRRLVLPTWQRVRAAATRARTSPAPSAAEQLADRKAARRAASDTRPTEPRPAELEAVMRAEPRAVDTAPARVEPAPPPPADGASSATGTPPAAPASLAERLLAKKRDGGPRP